MIPGWVILVGQPQDLLFHAEETFFSGYFPKPPIETKSTTICVSSLAKYVCR